MLADEKIKHDEYLEMVEDNNNELAQLVEKKNEMLSMLESEQVIDNIDKLKQELLQFLNFNELTPAIYITQLIELIKEGGTRVINYRFAAPTFE